MADGVTIFRSAYDSWRQVPRYDLDEGMMLVHPKQPKEKVGNLIVVVSDEATTHLVGAPDDHEAFKKPHVCSMSHDLDDEITFQGLHWGR